MGLKQNRKSQQGVFIAVFALATLVVISLAISFMSNRVNELLVGQSQMISGKQAYWSAYSGMELLSGSQLADASNTGTKTYSFSGGTISIVGESSAALYIGVERTNVHTVTGTDGNSSRAMKLELGDPGTGCDENVEGHITEALCDAGATDHDDNSTGHFSFRNALFFDGTTGDFVDIGTIEEKMEMQLSCFEDVGGHTTEALCDAGKAAHSDNATGHFNKIEYADDDAQADFSISLWVKPDYSAMLEGYGVFLAANNCADAQEGDNCNIERGIVLGVRRDNYFLRIWHTSEAQVDFETYEVSGEPAPLSADSWHHVVYTRSAALGSEVGKIYLNGVLLGTEDPDDSWFKDADDGELWYLGTDIDPGPVKSQNYAGCIDEVAIWRKVLSLAEIQSLYIQRMSFDIAANMSTELVAYWNFDGDGVDGSLSGYAASVTGAAYTGF